MSKFNPKLAVSGAVVFAASLSLGYWLVFTVSFLEDVLPHGGVW